MHVVSAVSSRQGGPTTKESKMSSAVNARDTEKYLAFAKDVARHGGMMIREAFHRPREAYERKTETDPVTETDRAVERYVFRRIRSEYSDHECVGEETAFSTEISDKPTWIVDPIDGTANFVHRIPMCAISIGFTVNKKLIVGVVYNPIIDELFEATHLTPSRLNGEVIHVSDVCDLTSACVSADAGSDRSDEKIDYILDNLKQVLVNKAQCVRMLGSCALNLSNVAAGRVDVFYERGPYAWDIAAGALIVRQAGGVVYSGTLDNYSAFDLVGRTVVAFTPTLRKQIDSLREQ